MLHFSLNKMRHQCRTKYLSCFFFHMAEDWQRACALVKLGCKLGNGANKSKKKMWILCVFAINIYRYPAEMFSS